MKLENNNLIIEPSKLKSVNLSYFYGTQDDDKEAVFLVADNIVIGLVNLYDDAEKYFEIEAECGVVTPDDFTAHSYIKINNDAVYLGALTDVNDLIPLSLEFYDGSDIGGDTVIYMATQDEYEILYSTFDLADEENFGTTFETLGDYDFYYRRLQSTLIDDNESTTNFLKSLELGFKVQGLK